MAESSGEPTRIITNTYAGSTSLAEHGRDVSAVEKRWAEIGKNLSYDQLLTNQLEAALTQGRKKVTVVDIGSGEAALFKNFLKGEFDKSAVRAFLKKHPEMKIEMIGITDAKSKEEFLSEETIPKEENDYPERDQIEARNIKYTLTARQTLDYLFKSKNIDPQVDLYLATWSLTYIDPNTFKIIVDNAIKTLAPSSGYMLAVGYAEGLIPGFVSKANDMPPFLDVRGSDIKDAPSLKTMLKWANMRFFRTDVNLEEEKRILEETEKKLISLGVLTQEKVDEVIKTTEQVAESDKSRLAFALSLRAHQTVNNSLDLLARKKALEFREMKQKTLKDLSQNYADKIEIEYSNNSFSINVK